MMGQDILAGQDLQVLFRWFHRHPELGHEEKETTARIKTILQQADIKFLPWQLPTGTAAVIEGAQPGEDNLTAGGY
jgi:amidohydrolase